MQLAYTGADLGVVASFHGGLPVPTEEEAKLVRARVLVEHGSADSFIPGDQLPRFTSALQAAGVDLTVNVREGAMHSFTVPQADYDDLEGTAYDESADRGSWSALLDTLDQAFAEE